MYGGATGIDASGNNQWTQGNAGGSVETTDRFGAALAAGDFNNSGHSDLVAGAPNENAGSISDCGAINVMYGGATGIDASGNSQFVEGNSAGTVEANDHFGFDLTAGDLNGSGHDDVGVGTPDEDSGSIANAGSIQVMYGGSAGIDATGNSWWTQGQTGAGTETGDRFGVALAAGDFNNSGQADLAAGAPGEDFPNPTVADAGLHSVLYGGASGITATGSVYFSQSSTGLNAIEAGDAFGSALN